MNLNYHFQMSSNYAHTLKNYKSKSKLELQTSLIMEHSFPTIICIFHRKKKSSNIVKIKKLQIVSFTFRNII